MKKLTARHKDIINAKICPYCNSGVKMMSELQVYGRTYKNRIIITCKNYPKCDSYVGTHDDGMPLGRLANKNLRILKKTAHHHFDKLWREKDLKRGEAYSELSEFLEIDPEYTHIGMFSGSTCRKVIEWSKKRYAELTEKLN